jgi:trimethylamine--corrinoid protein Co-methyltransferase
MRTGHFGTSADGHAMRLALCDLARYYDLPVNLWGLSTSSSSLDALYGHEATTYGLLAQLAGVDEVYSLGLLGSAQILSLDKMVLDNHLARQIGLMARPLSLDEAHLAVDLIEQVGIGGSFVGRRETRAATRRGYLPPWPPAGEEVLALVHREALEILHHHQPPPLPPGAAEQIEVLMVQADAVLA